MLQDYDAYLIDLDGTLYRGSQVLPDAVRFVQWFREHGKKFLFVTNNSSKTPKDVAAHLQHFGIEAKPEDVLTSAQATARYIQQNHTTLSPRVYLIGEDGLAHALLDIGCTLIDTTDADYVVVGIDRSFTYEKLQKASDAISNGATFIASNSDKRLPTERGLFPGAGSLAAAVATASGKEPIFIGKPERLMIDFSLEKLRVTADRAIMVGDNLETDILAAAHAGVDSLLLLTGYSKEEDVLRASAKPTYILQYFTFFFK